MTNEQKTLKDCQKETETLPELKEFDNTVLKETAQGYEELLKVLTKEVERVNAYKTSTPYGDVLLSERDAIVDAYAAIVRTIKDRGGTYDSTIAGTVKWTAPKPETEEPKEEEVTTEETTAE